MTAIFLMDLKHVPSEQQLAPFLLAEDWRFAQSFKNIALQKRYLYSRAVLRQQLAIYKACSIADLHIALDEHKKPYLADGPYFSISHSHFFSAITIADHPIGIDIEHTHQPIDPVLFDVCLSKEEKENWQSHSDFYVYWCAKEAVLKAHGTGLLYDPRQLTLNYDDKNILTTQIAEQHYYIQYSYLGHDFLVALAQPTPFTQSITHNWCSLRSFFL